MSNEDVQLSDSNSANGLDAGTLSPGMMLGKYRIDQRIGVGGMAVTYRGFDTMLHRPVAIKQIASNLASNPRWCEKFREEAQLIARLTDARNVVRIYELLAEKSGLFLILEFVDGKSLEDLLHENTLGVQASLEIIWNVALGLRAIHGKGIVHRDIKPANILVPPNRKAKIADFGVAGQWGTSRSAGMGTTRYMAPEMFHDGQIDGRSDIYALGFVGFEMLVGRARFNELFNDIVGDPDAQAVRWMNWHTDMNASLPSIRQINPDVPPLVAELIERMTAKPLDVRYQSIDDVITDIKERFAVPRGTLAAMATGQLPPPGGTGAIPPWQRKRTWTPQRIRVAMILVGILTVLAFGFAGYKIIQLRRSSAAATRQHQAAVKAFNQGLQSDDGLDAFQEAVDHWQRAQDADPNGYTTDGRRAHRNLPLAQAYVAMARKQWVEAEQYLEQAQRRDAAPAAINAARKHLSRLHTIDQSLQEIDEALAADDYARAQRELQKLAQVVPPYEGLTAVQKRVDEAQRQHVYQTQVAAGRKLLSDRAYDEAREAFVAARDALRPDDAAHRAEIEQLIASIEVTRRYHEELSAAERATAEGDYDGAVAHYATARSLQPSPELDAIYDKTRARALAAAGQRLMNAGQLRAAVAKFEAAVAIDPSLQQAQQALTTLGPIDDWEPIANEADTLFFDKKYAEALVAYEDANALIPTEHATERIRICRRELLFAKGDELAAKREWLSAEAAYREAANYGPQAAVDAKLHELEIYREYVAALDDGDMALRAKSFGRARTAYERARELKPGPEIDERFTDLTYARNLDAGQRALDNEDYSTALMWFKKAQEARDTEQIRVLIANAEAGAEP